MSSAGDTVRDLLAAAERLLHGGDGGRLDAELLLQRAMNTDRAWLYAHREAEVAAAAANDFRLMVRQRREGFPAAYLVGEREFWSLPFLVNRHTLIPRPETEDLVALALEDIGPEHEADVLDLGTGCGSIAIAVARERPRCRVLASDVSAEALAVARRNAERLQCSSVEFMQSDWFSGLGSRRFHLVLCNPPYVDSSDPVLHESALRFEPRLALDGGYGGLQSLSVVVACAPRYLHAGGLLALEHGRDQGTAVRALLRRHGFRDAQTRPDFAGFERITLARGP